MGKLRRLNLTVFVAAVTFPLVAEVAVAASYERCIQGYRNVQSPAYSQRLQRDGAAWAVKCPEGWDDKYRNDPDDTKMMADPCYGDPAICGEQLGAVPTYFECSGVAADKLGTPQQIQEADRIAKELSNITVCHYAQ